MTPEEKAEFRAAQDAIEQIADEVRARIGAEAYAEVIRRNQYESIQRGETLEFYRDEAGVAQYRFRRSTAAEMREHAEDWIEDNL